MYKYIDCKPNKHIEERFETIIATKPIVRVGQTRSIDLSSVVLSLHILYIFILSDFNS